MLGFCTSLRNSIFANVEKIYVHPGMSVAFLTIVKGQGRAQSGVLVQSAARVSALLWVSGMPGASGTGTGTSRMVNRVVGCVAEGREATTRSALARAGIQWPTRAKGPSNKKTKSRRQQPKDRNYGQKMETSRQKIFEQQNTQNR